MVAFFFVFAIIREV